MKRVTQKTIAEELHTSTVTVSNALSGRGGVSEQMRSRILQTAWKLGYQTTAQAAGSVTLSVGVIVAARYMAVGKSFYWSMYQELVRALFPVQGISMLEIVEPEAEQGLHLPAALESGDNNALIVIGAMSPEYLTFLTRSAQIPVVLLDSRDPDLDCCAVLSGNYTGMYRMTQCLIDHGFRKIGFAGDLTENDNILDRYFGYRAAMEDAGLAIIPEWVINDQDPALEAHLPARLPDAFACYNDLAAVRLTRVLSRRGIRIPEDLSLVGYDDYLADDIFNHTLTTCHVDMKRMAELAVQLADRGVRGQWTPGQLLQVDCPMIERSSVRDLSGTGTAGKE